MKFPQLAALQTKSTNLFEAAIDTADSPSKARASKIALDEWEELWLEGEAALAEGDQDAAEAAFHGAATLEREWGDDSTARSALAVVEAASLHYTVRTEDAGQMVEVAYSVDDENDRVFRRTHDRSAQTQSFCVVNDSEAWSPRSQFRPLA